MAPGVVPTEAGTTPAGLDCGMSWGNLTKARMGWSTRGEGDRPPGRHPSLAADDAMPETVLDLWATEVYGEPSIP